MQRGPDRREERTQRARRRDRRVYLRSHPVLFVLLGATRRLPVLRLGRTVIVHGTREYRQVLTQLPLDRLAPGTTGGAARELAVEGVLFDQEGASHRAARRSVAGDVGAAAVRRLRPIWLGVLDRRLAPLAAGGTVDLVAITAEIAGATTAALLELPVDPLALAAAARATAAEAVRSHLPRRPGHPSRTARGTEPAAALTALLRSGRPDGADRPDGAGRPDGVDRLDGADRPAGLDAMLALAAINTTVAAIPRAAAWCADARLWAAAADAGRRPVLVAELLRVVAPTPVLPRVAGQDGLVGAHRVRAGDRIVLVARHAALAHRRDPDCDRPAPAQVAQLVFGAGPHACPGAHLAGAMLADVLRLLAPYRPRVVTARPDRTAALPGWAVLIIRGTTAPPTPAP